MHTRIKVAVIACALSGIFVGVWRELADQRTAVDAADCNVRDALSNCAIVPPLGIPAGDLVFAEPELASAPANDGALAIIRFVPKAEAGDITEFLAANSITMVDGPKLGGMYTVRLPEAGKTKSDLIKRIQVETAIVDFIASVQ
jgi:hypothetical protein